MDLVICEPNLDSPGGRQRVILEIAKKYNPVIYTFAYKKEGTLPEFKNFDIRVPKELQLNARFTLRVGKAFAKMHVNNYDVINAHWGPSQWVRKHNPRVLWYCHSPIRAVYDLYKFRHDHYPFYLKPLHARFADWYRKNNAEIVPKIECIVANSQNTKKRLHDYLHASASIVHPGVHLRDYEDKGDGKFFLVLNRICPTKRIEYALEAYQIFRKEFPEWKLRIMGSLHPKDAAYGREIKRQFPEAEYNVTDAQKCKALSECTALLFTPMDEDFGIIPLEAMASSKPVISVNEGGPKESVLQNKTGYLVNSPQQMAERMKYLARHSEVAAQFGSAGRARVKKFFTWDVFLRQFDKHLKTVTKM